MNLKELAKSLGYAREKYPVGLGGCRSLESCSFEPCAYDLFVFGCDEPAADRIIKHDDGNVVIVRHIPSLDLRSGHSPLLYDGMRILHDPAWDLKMTILKVAHKRDALYRNLAKDSLLRSLFYCRRVRASIERGDLFASCWQKCASFYLADAICALNGSRPSPSHMLKTLRDLPKNAINEHLSIVTETAGLERATTTLLARMSASTVGFNDHAIVREARRRRLGGGRSGCDAGTICEGYSELISNKCNFFVSESMMADCYFYLGCVNKANISTVTPHVLGLHPDLFHILRVAFDVESDSHLLIQNADAIRTSCNALLGSMHNFA